jgi:hypothetical protein
MIALGDVERTVVLSLPDGPDAIASYVEDAAGDDPALRGLSPARLRLAMYHASWDDFRWTMSRKEFANHRHVVVAGGLTQGDVIRVETLFRDDIEALLAIREMHAELEWWATDGSAWGVVHFFQEPRIDLSWVRPVCESLRFSAECHPGNNSREEHAELFDIVEPEP